MPITVQQNQQPTQTTEPQAQPQGPADMDRLHLLQQAAELVGQVGGWEAAARALSTIPHPAARIAGAGLGAAVGGTVLDTLVSEDPLSAAQRNTYDALAGAAFASALQKTVPVLRQGVTKATEAAKDTELFGLTARAVQQAGERIEAAQRRLTKAVGTILSNTKKTGGATYNLTKGDLAGTEHYAVSTHPDRTRILDHEPTPNDIQDYIYRNSDLLSRDDKSVGVWHNTANKTWELDVTSTVSSIKEAVHLAQKHRELAAFSLKDFREIPTWYQLEHYSKVKNLSTLDPAFFGTGSAGEEAKRVLYEGAPKRIDYYIKGTEPEPILSKNAKYEIAVPASRIYDVARDRDGIVAKFPNKTDWENELKAQGYLGYINPNAPNSAAKNSVVVFHPLPAIPSSAADSIRFGETMASLIHVNTESAAKPALTDLATQLFRYNPTTYANWKADMQDWVPQHLRDKISPATWRELYQTARSTTAKSIEDTMPKALPRLLELHGTNSPYVNWEQHIMPVLQQWVGERAPLMVSAIGAASTETGVDLKRAIKAYNAVLTAPTTESLKKQLTALKIAPNEALMSAYATIQESGMNSAAVSRQLGRLLHIVSTDPTLKGLNRATLTDLATTIRSRTPISERQTFDAFEAAVDTMRAIESSPADKPLWSALTKLTEKNWAKWKEKYNIPDLGTPDMKRRLALITVLSAAAASGINAAPPDARAAVYESLQADGLYLSPRSVKRLTDAAIVIRSAYTE